MIIGYDRQTPESLETRTAGYEPQARSMNVQTRFTVNDLTAESGPRPVGTTALRIDHHVRTAEYVILLGEEGRGRRLAADATRRTLDYAFHITNLRAVWLEVLEHNIAGIRAYQAAGFKPVGAGAAPDTGSAPSATRSSWTQSASSRPVEARARLHEPAHWVRSCHPFGTGGRWLRFLHDRARHPAAERCGADR